jgi:hypothetical protein
LSVLAVFVSLVVYENLLFFTLTVQAGGQDKTFKIRQEINRFFLSLRTAGAFFYLPPFFTEE